MSTPSSVYAGLCWKESRQLVPLVAMLVGTTFFVLLLWTFDGPGTHRILSWGGSYLAFLMPGLYAAGAGAILVGQEKETRTLWWNAAMPIAPGAMIGSKLAIAFAGLVVMWMTTFGLLIVLPLDAVHSVTLTSGDLARWLSYSLFLLATGFYTAWRFQSAFTSLLMLIPIALLPALVTNLAFLVRKWISGRGYFLEDERLPIELAILLGAFVLMAWLAIRAAQRTLGPAPAREERYAASTGCIQIVATKVVGQRRSVVSHPIQRVGVAIVSPESDGLDFPCFTCGNGSDLAAPVYANSIRVAGSFIPFSQLAGDHWRGWHLLVGRSCIRRRW